MKRNAWHWGRRFPKVVTGCISVLSAAAFAADVTVTIDNVKENRGAVHIVIYDVSSWMDGDPNNFSGSQSVDITKRKDDGPLVTHVELEPDRYCAFVYHDVNANDKLDKRLIGIPKEPYGFSGSFKKRRIPRFEECVFVIGEEAAAAISVRLQN